MTPLSVVIITFNEEKHIGNCLESVKDVADEIVVVDSYSTDQTKAICEQYHVKFIQHPFKGHIEQKNFALTQSTHTHVLSLDADECLSQQLQQSISKVKSDWQHDGYIMNRLSNFCGRWIRYSGWYPDRKLRLFNKNKGNWGGTNPHDRFEMSPDATIAWIAGDLLHYTAESEQVYMRKMESYSTIAATEMFRQNRSNNSAMLHIKTATTFLRHYIFRLGFLDGKMGWKVSKISAFYTYQKYLKLQKLRKGQEIK